MTTSFRVKKQILKFLCATWLLTHSGSAFAATSQQSCPNQNDYSCNIELQKEIRDKVAQLKKDMQVPNLAVSFFTSDQVMDRFGMGDVDGVATDPHKSLFNVGSIAKTMTSAAVFQMVEKGQLDLHKPITEYENTFFKDVASKKCPKKLTKLKKITLAHLLSHNAGISMDPSADIFYSVEGMADGELVSQKQFNSNFCDIEFIYEPGTTIKYSNTGYVLIKQIIESQSSSKNFAEHMKKNIFDAMDINESVYELTETDLNILIPSYGNKGSAYPEHGTKDERTPMPKIRTTGELQGAVGLSISNTSLAKMGQEMLSWTNPNKQSKLFANKDTWKSIIYPVSRYLSASKVLGYGYLLTSFDLETKSGQPNKVYCYGHTGSAWGFRNILYVCPEIDWGFAAQFNAKDTNREKYLVAVANALSMSGLLDKKQAVPTIASEWVQATDQFVSSVVLPTPVPKGKPVDASLAPLDLQEFLGDFYAGAVGVKKVEMGENGKLVFMGYELTRETDDSDVFRWPKGAPFNKDGEPVIFNRDENGEINGLVTNWALHHYKL